MIYFIFLQVWFRSPVISSVIGETGRSFRFGVNPSLCFFPHCGWEHHLRQRQRDEQSPCNDWSI